MKNRLLCALDWSMPDDVQKLGIALAKEEPNIWMFIQPMSEKYNKSVWENCAKVLKDKSDETLLPYLIPLIEWLQDLTWPGAEAIFERLSAIPAATLSGPISYSVMRAVENDDTVWLGNISMLVQQSNSSSALDIEVVELLDSSSNEFGSTSE